ncbi:Vgb family protein [Paraburkholderia sediminicola]|uniref:Vgb family protein n=1 Tax=Paraburkholderia sediminicola TaxID=458836 RepID=UPI0038BDAA31
MTGKEVVRAIRLARPARVAWLLMVAVLCALSFVPSVAMDVQPDVYQFPNCVAKGTAANFPAFTSIRGSYDNSDGGDALQAASVVARADVQTISPASVIEFTLAYPQEARVRASIPSYCLQAGGGSGGSTHEITYRRNGDGAIWITAPNYDRLVRIGSDTRITFYPLPVGSGPHGIVFDEMGRLWVSLECAGEIVRLDEHENISAEYDVALHCSTCSRAINSFPHGLGVGSDGKTIWYTGQRTGTVGKITPDGIVKTYALPTVGSVPIYIRAGPDGNMWATELVGNAIARITPDGAVTEFPIPTYNSRPIAIVPAPDGKAMWFTEEAGNKLGRIDMRGEIVEFAVPKSQDNVILAALSFDDEGNLWVEQYVDQNNPGTAGPSGSNHIVKIDKAILHTAPLDMGKVPVTLYPVPTRATVLHRIIQGPDGNIWFTELTADKVGKLIRR